ncbi:MAG: RNA polymerase factor sigma-54 [Alphaproteobacteria bacterium]
MLKQNISQRPSIKINQKINSNIINSIKILQMSSNELTEYTQKEIEKNPFLISNKKKSYNDTDINIDNYAKNSNVKEWLYEQSSFISLNIWGEKLVQCFIENINDKGFCKISIEEAALETKTSLRQAKLVLKKLKLLDPEGIFSSSLEEHLSFQLKKKKLFNNNYKIIISHLNDIASGNYNKLAKLCSLKEHDIIKMVNNIKLLKPTPIDSLEIENIERIIPDIIVKKHKNNIICSLNNTNNYEVLIDEKYLNEIKIQQKILNVKDTKEYIKNCIAHGRMLQNNLNRRNNTLLKISEKILNYQKNFFLSGEEELLPLTHKIISDKIIIHESTVSRTVKNKYIKFNNKVLPLKYFFISRTNYKDKKINNSATSIKVKIMKIIDNEENNNIYYSDNNIVNILNKENIIISRRTVTKYRESLNIANSLIRSKNKF